MPIILPIEQNNPWLASASNINDVMQILTSPTSEDFDFHPVSKQINRVSESTDSKESLKPITL